jgi:hypothetical protein
VFPKRREPRAPLDREQRWLRIRAWCFRLIGAAFIAGTAASFYESFSGLVGWFRRIGFTGERAIIAPAMIDLVALICDVILVVLIVEKLDAKHKATRGIVVAGVAYGLALSVIGNAGRDGLRWGLAGWFDMGWNAVPPLSLAILMTVVLLFVKVWFKAGDEQIVPALPDEVTRALVIFADHVKAGTLPTYPQIREALGVGQGKASHIRRTLADSTGVLRAAGDLEPVPADVAALNGGTGQGAAA